MAQLLQANELTLANLQKQFGLTRSRDRQFFTEWLDELPTLTDTERIALDRIQSNFLNQQELQLMIEETVKMVVVAPLLDLAGFYQSPFRIESEVPIQLEVPGDEAETMIQGRLDTLIVQKEFWVLIVESKRTQLSIHTGIPQILTYMLASPKRDRPVFGLVTNGSEFSFVKLLNQATPQFDLSNLFSLSNRGNDLYGVLRAMKRIGSLIHG